MFCQEKHDFTWRFSHTWNFFHYHPPKLTRSLIMTVIGQVTWINGIGGNGYFSISNYDRSMTDGHVHQRGSGHYNGRSLLPMWSSAGKPLVHENDAENLRRPLDGTPLRWTAACSNSRSQLLDGYPGREQWEFGRRLLNGPPLPWTEIKVAVAGLTPGLDTLLGILQALHHLRYEWCDNASLGGFLRRFWIVFWLFGSICAILRFGGLILGRDRCLLRGFCEFFLSRVEVKLIRCQGNLSAKFWGVLCEEKRSRNGIGFNSFSRN